MAKVDDFSEPDWDEPPLPLGTPRLRKRNSGFRQLGLRHIMVALVFVALLCWALKRVMETNEILAMVMVGVMIGLGTCAFGLWAAAKLSRAAVVGWIIFSFGYLTLTASTASALAIPMFPILYGCIIYIILQRHSNNQDSLLWVLRVAADRGMPLDPGVRTLSQQVSGMFQIWTETLADLLRRGVPLPDALDGLSSALPRTTTLVIGRFSLIGNLLLRPSLVPRNAKILIRMGWESGNLALGLREAVESRTIQMPFYRAIISRVAYLCWIAFAANGIVGFVMYFIMPKFEAIFKDFGVSLPEITILTIHASHFYVDYFWIPTLAFFTLFMSMIINLIRGHGFSLPGFERLFFRRHTILILRSLVVAVEGGRPMASTFETLGEWYPTSWVRSKLRRASEDVDQGVEYVEALKRNGLISSTDAGVLRSAQRAGNLAWALRELAETSERRLGYRLQAFTQILFVVSMLLLGSVVFLIAVSYFAPLTTLITSLSK